MHALLHLVHLCLWSWPPALPPPIWCLCSAPTSSSQRQTNRSEWKTISHIPLASYVMHPIVTQHVMYVSIYACSRPSNRGVQSPIVFFPSTFVTWKSSVRFRKVLSSFTTCAGEKLPRKATSETKRLEPWAFWHLWSPFSPTQETHTNKNLPTKHWRQATWHHSNHVLLASVHAPRCASPGQWSWHLNPPEGHVPKRLVSCFRLGGWGPLAEPPDGPKEPSRRPKETGRWRGGEVLEF